MGLAIELNILGQLQETGDDEGKSHFKSEFELVNLALAANGIDAHAEPEGILEFKKMAPFDSFPYAFVHCLRSALAFSRNGGSKERYIKENAAENDHNEFVEIEILERLDSHVICHSDCEGYYLPIDFEEVIFAEDDYDFAGGMLCSSNQAMKELESCADFIGILIGENGDLSKEVHYQNSPDFEEDPFFRERMVWLCLYDAARLSIELKSAIVFA